MVRIARPDLAWFASDIHLDDHQDELTARFLEAIAALPDFGCTTQARDDDTFRPALFLLGDLFEVWVGDDIPGEAARLLAQGLQTLAARGWRVYLMRGNRDFLLDVPVPGRRLPAFSAQCGARLLADPCLIEVAGRRILLTHGDAWCVDDVEYQRFRALSRTDRWQRRQLARPPWQRQWIGRYARARSRWAQRRARRVGRATRPQSIGHVDIATVRDALDAADAEGAVHGHTHRPTLRQWTNRGVRQWLRVLPDWSAGENEATSRGTIESLAQWLQWLEDLEPRAGHGDGGTWSDSCTTGSAADRKSR